MTCQGQPAKCEVLWVVIFQVMHHVARGLTPMFRRLSFHQPTCHTTTTTEIMSMAMTMNTLTRIPEDLQIMSLCT